VPVHDQTAIGAVREQRLAQTEHEERIGPAGDGREYQRRREGGPQVHPDRSHTSRRVVMRKSRALIPINGRITPPRP
jgi:hypothetical protein